MSLIRTLALPPRQGRARHDHMVRRFSRDYDRLTSLAGCGADRETAREIIETVAAELLVPPPEVTFHGRRGPYTGYCVPPLATAISVTGVEGIRALKRRNGKPWPTDGMIRLGDPASLSTIAHELGHHLVHVLDPISTPSHGKVWVGRFDEAAAKIEAFIAVR